VKSIEDIRILVVGDIMLDKYVVGDVSRISPEAPVPIVHVNNEYSTLGGCGNVARNLAELGVQVYCCASTGPDAAQKEIYKQFDRLRIHNRLIYQNHITTVKERIIADDRQFQMLRIDREIATSVDEVRVTEVLKRWSDDPYDMILVSDYNKGMITMEVMDILRSLNVPIIIDPKPCNGFLYERPLMITPNKNEWREMELDDECSPEFVLVTEGKDGMTLYDYRQGKSKIKIPGKPVEVYNVSGAGDSVIAIMAICLCMDIYPDKAARVANDCAAYVVTQVGTSTVPKNIFMNSLSHHVNF
jgi:rfaE bifunctional protein kinase chain/domain